MQNELVWQSLDEPGWEHVRVQSDHPGWTVFDSIFVREHNGQVLRGGYTLVTDKQWRTLELRLMVESAPGVMEGIHILSEGDGKWTDANEQPMPQLDGCLDVDIRWTPLTNSLPINRIPLTGDEEHEIRVAYINMPDMMIEPITQRYSRINAGTVKYASANRDRVRELSVDEDGLVEHYPDLFARTWPAPKEQ